MKLLISTDVQLGAACTENLGIKLSHKWQSARTEKMTELLDQASQKNATYIILCGKIFGQKRVSESVIDDLFRAVSEDDHIQVLAFLIVDEYNRIVYRKDIPKNLHIICTQTEDSYDDETVSLKMDKGVAKLQLSKCDTVTISQNANESFTLSYAGKEQIIPSFEPVGFEDSESNAFGYDILEWEEAKIMGISTVKNQKYAYESVELKILPEDGQKEIIRKINASVAQIGIDTMLRITIVGKSAFGLTLNSDSLEKQLQNRVFFVEVYDNTIMDIDEESFENDISLRSEFVRLALQDDSLSESERNRIISCGWNALNGKEVSTE